MENTTREFTPQDIENANRSLAFDIVTAIGWLTKVQTEDVIVPYKTLVDKRGNLILR